MSTPNDTRLLADTHDDDPYGPDEMGVELAGGPAAVAATLSELRAAHPALPGELARAPRILLVGTGASLAMARCAQVLWRVHDAATGCPRSVETAEATELLLGPLAREATRGGSVVVAVSKSGKSPETLAVARSAQAAGLRVVSVTAVPSSPLAGLADAAVVTPIGEEHGAATKSELAALAALLALGGVIPTDVGTVDELHSLLAAAVSHPAPAMALGARLARARRIWVVGFGSAAPLAEALALLWHEKARTPAFATTPSGFRHGLVEASDRDDAVVAFDCDAPSPDRGAYLRLFAAECASVGLLLAWLAADEYPGKRIALSGSNPAARALESLLRAQQLARAAAHAGGTYVDGFRVLRTHARPSQPVPGW